MSQISDEEDIPRSTIEGWIRRFLDKGEEGLMNQKKAGNHFAALHTSKSLTEVERLELEINGTYPKLIFKLLKQWKETGEYTISIEKFRELLDVPEWYRMSELDRKVLDPSINELRKIKDFEDLTVTKIKKGRKVVKLKFNFSE